MIYMFNGKELHSKEDLVHEVTMQLVKEQPFTTQYAAKSKVDVSGIVRSMLVDTGR